MAPFNPTMVIFSFLFILGMACPTPGEEVDFTNFESPYEDLPRNSRDWTRSDWQTAIDRNMHAHIYNYERKPRDSSAPSRCASSWAEENSGAESAAASVVPGGPAAANQYVETSRSGPEDYGFYSGQQGYQGGYVYPQHPNLAQFNRYQTTSSWIPGFANTFYGRASDQVLSYDQYANQQIDQFSKYPVAKSPDVVDTSPAAKAASQYGYSSPNMYRASYRATEAKPQQAEDANSVKTTSPQYYDYADYYRQQIQQALADGKQLTTGIPNAAVNQHLGPGTVDKLSPQASPVFSTATFPVTTLTFDPEEMKRIYGQHYVPPVFNIVQRQPYSLEAASPGVVRDVLQYLLNQYQSPIGGFNDVAGGAIRGQRLLPGISNRQEQILHGFAPLETLPRQSMPLLPAFGGDNQPLPPNLYRSEKWQPKTNLVVHEPVNLADLERVMNHMGQYQHAARSTPCSRHKRQSDDIWGYYPELTPGGGRTAQPMAVLPGLKTTQMFGAPQYGWEQPQMRTAIPGLPGYENPLRQSFGGIGQLTGQPMGGIGQQGYPGYYPYQGRDAVSGISQVIAGISQLMSGQPQFRK